MGWLDHHGESERLASEAEVQARRGDVGVAREFYSVAAEAEDRALESLDGSRPRTYGVTAVSAVALYYKSARWDDARTLAYRCLASGFLPDFALRQIEDLLVSIQVERTGMGLGSGRILVSMRGGQVLHGGAPLDLVVEKTQRMRSLLYRTAEYLERIPHRTSSDPSRDIQDAYRPWIFQAAHGSYQFEVALQSDGQRTLFGPGSESLDRLSSAEPDRVVGRLFGILQACVESPGDGLLDLVEDTGYRGTFLKLTRDLAPTGRGRFSQMDILSSGGGPPLVLVPAVRGAINRVIREGYVQIADPLAPNLPEEEIPGVLRAVHLELDWIEVMSDRGMVRVERMGQEVDDRIGPMVNNRVLVRVVPVGDAYHFRDVELEE